MTEYEYAGVEVLEAPNRHDMSTWLANDRPRRRAAIPPSPGIDLTQSTDASNTSQFTGEAVLSDDYTGSEDDSRAAESMEGRSVNTETGLPDTQLTDDTFSPEEKKEEKREEDEEAEESIEEREATRRERGCIRWVRKLHAVLGILHDRYSGMFFNI